MSQQPSRLRQAQVTLAVSSYEARSPRPPRGLDHNRTGSIFHNSDLGLARRLRGAAGPAAYLLRCVGLPAQAGTVMEIQNEQLGDIFIVTATRLWLM
jgi:hypothetical protein